jgi:hypothetical protein
LNVKILLDINGLLNLLTASAVVKLTRRSKRKRESHDQGRDKAAADPFTKPYPGKNSWEKGLEMLEGAKRSIRVLRPSNLGNNWSEIRWLTEETLSRAIDAVRPNVREVWLPRLYPDDTGSDSRKYEYSQSLKDAAEITREILATAGAECGKDFQEVLKSWLLKYLRRKEVRNLAKPDPKINLKMIQILHEISVRCVSHPKELKVLAPAGTRPDRWAHDVGVQLTRFCDRVYRVWNRLDRPPLEKICFVPGCQSALRAECSLEFPRDICVAGEAIERSEKAVRKDKHHQPLNKHSLVPRRK